MSTDAIVLLKEDHKEMRRLFREFEKAQEGPASRRRTVVDEIVAALTTHTYLENEVMYPEVRKLLPDLEDDILESYEEHHVADVLCAELAAMDADDDHFVAKTTVLIENVEHHVEEEEQEWFPKVREALGRNQLQEIGERMIALRPDAPRSPSDPKAVRSARHATTA
ncbi:hemerythrin domain-containing protein [Micromonospora rifamycinica]|uniref:Hemerythrin HHE cation binding domain-containing protein n=1 Tax=Micromonospora rifamycinica TaxID=291594 RepID=A0A125Q0N2_9ACTN|nr:hemerythrin domain-containing protein [Micromonospora rifamycinica]KWV29527.1 hemerythrin [Micromonospora rifamycinica]SCG43505.1 Hemerythrin HHE cation binding domain-containing protein [Micromonospora rifamycinica]